MVAFDAAGNAMASQMVRAKPLDQGIRPPIQNPVAEYVNGANPFVRIRWNYANDVDLAGFQIYRAIDNSQTRSFKFVGTMGVGGATGLYGFDDFDMEIRTLLQKSLFTKPPAQPGGLATTITPQVVNKGINGAPFNTLRYRIMAVYMDGAQSPLSDELQVVIQ